MEQTEHGVADSEQKRLGTLRPFGKDNLPAMLGPVLFQQSGNIARIILAIAIHQDNGLARVGQVALDIREAGADGALMP
jgi:hypothetical protein